MIQLEGGDRLRAMKRLEVPPMDKTPVRTNSDKSGSETLNNALETDIKIKQLALKVALLPKLNAQINAVRFSQLSEIRCKIVYY